MKIYTISYELNNPTLNSGTVDAVIEKYDHCQCLGSTWLIATEEPFSEVSKAFQDAMKDGDRYWLVTIHPESDGYSGRYYRRYGVSEWLNKVLTKNSNSNGDCDKDLRSNSKNEHAE